MKVVILAAGKGTRLGELTKDRPKPMLLLNGRPMLEYVLGSLPDLITEAIIVIGYRGEMIRQHFGDHFGRLPISYCEQGTIGGTAGALWSAREFLHDGPFLIVQGDDLHLASELMSCIARPLAYGVHRMRPEERSQCVDTDMDGNLLGWHPPTPEEAEAGIPVTTGTYVLDSRIFRYDPAPMPNGEYSLPQTILALAKDYPVPTVRMDHWLTVTYPTDVQAVERSLAQTPWHPQRWPKRT